MDDLKVGLNESGRIEMEEEEEDSGEMLEDKLAEFDEILPNLEESASELGKEENEDSLDELHKLPSVQKEVLTETEDSSPVSNGGHSIVTEATIEAHDVTNLEASACVSIWFCFGVQLDFHYYQKSDELWDTL